MSNDDLTKILIPMIRKVYPNIIAQSILGVQPMSGPTYRTFTMDADYVIPYHTHPKYKFSRKWFIGKVHRGDIGDDAAKWCAINFGNQPKNPDAWCRWYRYSSKQFYFRDEKDYHWFVLRWS